MHSAMRLVVGDTDCTWPRGIPWQSPWYNGVYRPARESEAAHRVKGETPMETEHLREFLELAKDGSFT